MEPPLLLIASVCAAGFAAPSGAAYVRLDGSTAIVGGGSVMTSVTSTDCGVLVAPAAVTLRVAECVPTPRAAISTDTATSSVSVFASALAGPV